MANGEFVPQSNTPIPTEFDDTLSSQGPVRRTSGGSMQTRLSHTIVLNEHSSLTREWITIDDEKLPAKIVGVAGVSTIYEKGTDYSAGGYYYDSEYGIKTIESLSAFETRFLTFDVWGEHVRTLSSAQIMDLAAGEIRHIKSRWVLYEENEASEMYASIAFVAQVRTTAGQVLMADLEPVLSEAKQFSSKFEESSLSPSPRRH